MNNDVHDVWNLKPNNNRYNSDDDGITIMTEADDDGKDEYEDNPDNDDNGSATVAAADDNGESVV